MSVHANSYLQGKVKLLLKLKKYILETQVKKALHCEKKKYKYAKSQYTYLYCHPVVLRWGSGDLGSIHETLNIDEMDFNSKCALALPCLIRDHILSQPRSKYWPLFQGVGVAAAALNQSTSKWALRSFANSSGLFKKTVSRQNRD